MAEQGPTSMPLEQRFLERQRALILDVLEGNELIPTNYTLVPTQADFEAYYADSIGSIGEAGEGFSLSGPVGEGS